MLANLILITASRALVSDANGDVSVATTTATEIGYVNGVTGAIQGQIDEKASKGFATAMAIALWIGEYNGTRFWKSSSIW